MDTFRELESFFRELPRRLEETSFKAMQYSAEKIQTDLSTIFKTEGRSHNVDWSPLNEAYLKWKIKKGYSEKKLHRTTTLAQSFTYMVEPHKAIVGTPVEYAPYHEYGTKRGIPPRPFMTPVFRRFIESGYLKTAFSVAFREVFG